MLLINTRSPNVNMISIERPIQMQEFITNVMNEPLNSVDLAIISMPGDTYQEHNLPNTIKFPTLAQKESIKDINIYNHFSLHSKKYISQVLNHFLEVFSDIPNKTTIIQHRITLTSDTPINYKIQRLILLHYISTVQKDTQECIKLQTLTESYSDYLSTHAKCHE